MVFTLDENGRPVDCEQTENTDANNIVKEFMLLTNITVSQRHVAVHLPEQALLRRHDMPLERRLNLFTERANRLNIAVDVSSSGAIMKSFVAITNPTARMGVKHFCAGMLDMAKYNHYALSVPLYTHFTSPIRRYADVLVYRQLESVLQGGAVDQMPNDLNRDVLDWLAKNSNDEQLKKVKQNTEAHAVKIEVHLALCMTRRPLFDEDDAGEDKIVLGRDMEAENAPGKKAAMVQWCNIVTSFDEYQD
ncbi:hypothetical protein EDD22DRAFT_1029230 [Suillus occidentalis]|nr:hypothetical protein EDD22DRAFT_1029230 [Suillus occidentalis]